MLHGVDPLRQCIDVIESLVNRGASLIRQELTLAFVHPLPELGDPLNALTRDDAEFRQQSAHRIDRGGALANEQASERGGATAAPC